ncbi:MAG: hypothetical protein IJW26_03710, partial [Clostridia bacterium]|nr:hypothetical protein [Clostridia bacterium]
GNYAFSCMWDLTSVTIGNNVTSIGYGAFFDSRPDSIVFSDTSTWYITESYSDWQNKTNGKQIGVTSPSANATNLKKTYFEYYWYKK